MMKTLTQSDAREWFCRAWIDLDMATKDRDKYLVNRARYMKYDTVKISDVQHEGLDHTKMVKMASAVVTSMRLFKFEVRLCLIVFKDKVSDPSAAISRAEKSFLKTKLAPSKVVFAPLWDRVQALKGST